MVSKHIGLNLLRVRNLESRIARFQHTRVSHLAARLGIERRGVQDNDGFGAGVNTVDRRAIHVDGSDVPLPLKLFISFEAGVYALITQAAGRLELARRPGLLALAGHGNVKPGQIHFDIAFAADVGGEVDREPVCVIQGKQRLAIQLASLAQASQGGFKDLHAVFKLFTHSLYFLAQHLFYPRLIGDQLWLGVPHVLDQILDQAVEERLGLPQLVTMTQGPTYDSAQDITPTFVAGYDTVNNQKPAGAALIGNYLEGAIAQISSEKRV